MQCHSYLPVYQSHYDVNVDTSGGSKPMYNGNGSFQNGHYVNHAPPLPIPLANYAHKEMVRQTMVMHDVTFRDQVQELHRLYRRQRELMTEIKTKDLSINQRQVDLRSSNSSSTTLFSSVQSNNLQSLPFLSSQYRQNTVNTNNSLQRASICIQVTTPNVPVVSQNEISPMDVFLVSKGKMIGGKLLDLELPAETYIDNDELESLGNAQYAEGPIVCPEKINKLPEMGGTPEISENRSSLVIQGLPSLNNHSSSSKYTKFPSDHKECAEKSFGMPTSIQSSVPMPKVESVDCLSSIASNQLKYVNSSSSIDLNSALDPSSTESLPISIPEEKFACSVQSLGLTDVTSCETMRKSKRFRVIDINLPCESTTDDESFTEHGLIDLNICISEVHQKSSSLDKNGVELHLEAPTSPEVQERVPYRGDTLGERVMIAAETIVSMSYKKTLLYPESKISDCGDLEWFAELVYSFSTELDNDTGTMTLNKIDDFEAMTLKLTEIKSEEYFCRNSVEISSQTTCSVLITGKARRGRTKRSKRKDFQREVLPALSSLSRFEVTEDLQILEGLMEAAGTPWQLRTRRGRRIRKKPQVNKKQSFSNVKEVKGEFVISWGRDNRRPRGHRKRVNPAVFTPRLCFYQLSEIKKFDYC